MYILNVNHFSGKTGKRTHTIHPWHTSITWVPPANDPSDCCWMVPGTVDLDTGKSTVYKEKA